MKTRSAVVYRPKESVVIEELELEPPHAGEVLIKLTASGVCHSDLSVITGTIPFRFPAILGHEGAGIVAEVGDGVRSVRPGDSVVLSYVTPCGRCPYCTTGRPNLCITNSREIPRGTMLDGTCRFTKNGEPYYQLARLGTMSEYIVAAENAVIRVSADTPLDKAALIGCAVTTGVGAVLNTAKVEAGSSVVVIGAGGIGLNVVQGAALVGAEPIVVVDVAVWKLEYARQFGASHPIDASADDPIAKVLELTDGLGADYAFEAIGASKTIEQAFHMLRPGGTAVVIGIAPPDATVSLPAQMFPYGERRLVGCYYGSSRMRVDIPRFLNLYRAGRLKLDELVTRTYSLDEVNEAFEDMTAGRNARGVILFP